MKIRASNVSIKRKLQHFHNHQHTVTLNNNIVILENGQKNPEEKMATPEREEKGGCAPELSEISAEQEIQCACDHSVMVRLASSRLH